MGGCSDGRHSWENLNLEGHFFRYGWSVSVMLDRRGSGTNCWRAASRRHQKVDGVRWKMTHDHVWLSLSPSAHVGSTTLPPGLPRSQPRCHGSASQHPRGPALTHSHTPHPWFPVRVALWHLLDRTEWEGQGRLGVCVSTPNPLTL